MKRFFMLTFLIGLGLILGNFRKDANEAETPNIFDCNIKYTYGNWQEPHTTFEHNIQNDLDISFIYSVYDDITDRSGTFLVTSSGDVFLIELNEFHSMDLAERITYVENMDFSEIELITTIPLDIISDYIASLAEVVSCKPVNISMAHAIIDILMTYYGIFGVRDEKAVVLLEHSELYYKTSTDDNAKKIVDWFRDISLEDYLPLNYKYVDSDYYEEPHPTSLHSFGENTPIRFLYEKTLPDESQHRFLMVEDGSIYVVEDTLLSWSDFDFEERVPSFQLDSWMMEYLLQYGESLNFLNPVWIDKRNSYLEELLPTELFQMVRGDTIATLEQFGNYSVTSLEGDVGIITTLLTRVYELIFEENHNFPSEEVTEVPVITYDIEKGSYVIK
ncbi:MAG: hypothetical protein R3Y63_13580 [Eubacteriales bacterium]